ncbi:MAG: homoserine dehydrogenase [Candidatus Gastranaerophilales bacterium]|nr:homoserine dehydrogenase [Candidatus Gastranaerophilales bacterium]
MEKFNIGIIGLGTVGGGVVKNLPNFRDTVNLKKIAVHNLNKKRNIEGLDESLLTDNPYEIVNDKDIDIVVEVMGGVNPAFDLLKTAINNGKHIVTANKELLAKHGEELFNLAKEKNVVILYEAAIAGGIPIIMPVKTILRGNKITKIDAILNGTTNYILTKMDEDGAPYEQVLKKAQELGYAETDPTSDVEGFDAAYKIVTLATISFNKRVKIGGIYREGITKISDRDIKFANEFGYKIKLIASAKLDDNGRADVRVHPMLVPKDHVLAKINNVTNAIMLSGKPVGEIMFTGAGAGEMPTASSVLGDILALCSEIGKSDFPLPMMRCNHESEAERIPIDETVNRYYISLDTADTPGSIGVVGTICGNHGINLSDILQKGSKEDGTAEVVVITALSREKNVKSALKEMKKSNAVVKINNLIRVMN